MTNKFFSFIGIPFASKMKKESMMLKIKTIILLLFYGASLSLRAANITFAIKEGTYLGENCFLDVKRDDGFIHMRFAHTDLIKKVGDGNQNLTPRSEIMVSGEEYNSNVPFTPEHIAGINIIVDDERNWVEFGPSICNKKLANLKTIRTDFSYSIYCGNNFSRVNVDFKVIADQDHHATSFYFSEKINKARRIVVLPPWTQEEIFRFRCDIKK